MRDITVQRPGVLLTGTLLSPSDLAYLVAWYVMCSCAVCSLVVRHAQCARALFPPLQAPSKPLMDDRRSSMVRLVPAAYLVGDILRTHIPCLRQAGHKRKPVRGDWNQKVRCKLPSLEMLWRLAYRGCKCRAAYYAPNQRLGMLRRHFWFEVRQERRRMLRRSKMWAEKLRRTAKTR